MSKLVYIAGKYTSDSVSTTIHYVNLAVETAKIVFEKTNFIPIIPHKITELWDYDKRFLHYSAEDWLNKYCYPLLDRCDYLLVSNGLFNSYGVAREILYAKQKNIPVFYSLEEFLKFAEDINEIKKST